LVLLPFIAAIFFRRPFETSLKSGRGGILTPAINCMALPYYV
jgi:hypothetical protein